MSRGGRGRRFRGGVPPIDKNAPEVELDHDIVEGDIKELVKPTPLFPPIKVPQPTPLTTSERNAVSWYRQFRDSMRDSPFFTELDPGIVTNDRGKANPRAGVDPFEAIETFTKKKYVRPKRTYPDFSQRTFALEFFPRELWSTIDPERKRPEWKTLPDKVKWKHSKPRKSGFEDDSISALNNDLPDSEGDSELDLTATGKRKRPEVDEDEEDEDITAYRRRRRQKAKLHDPTKKRSGEKEGLDAEDVIEEDEADKLGDDEREDGASDDTLSDSHFSDEEEGQEGDYGDNFFDPGEDDVDDMGDDPDGGGREDEGGTY